MCIRSTLAPINTHWSSLRRMSFPAETHTESLKSEPCLPTRHSHAPQSQSHPLTCCSSPLTHPHPPEQLEQDVLLEHVDAHGGDVGELGRLLLGDAKDGGVNFLEGGWVRMEERGGVGEEGGGAGRRSVRKTAEKWTIRADR